jgi:hypothetical protein
LTGDAKGDADEDYEDASDEEYKEREMENGGSTSSTADMVYVGITSIANL